MPRFTALWLLCACLMFGQATAKKQEYRSVYDNTNGSATARVLTVQLPALAGSHVLFSVLSVYCEQACSFTIERDGSTATGSSTSPAKLLPLASWVAAVSPALQVFAGSNSTGGTDVGGAPYFVFAGDEKVIDISPQVFEKGKSVVQNLTVRTSAVVGRVIVRVFSEERAIWP